MIIRGMQGEDVPAIASLEQAFASPWSSASLTAELSRVHAIQLVAEDDASGIILGWCCALLAGPEAELLKIAVLSENRQCGVGTALLLSLCTMLHERQVNQLFLEVREQNFTARNFYQKNGFLEVGQRSAYYSCPQDNALIFRKELLYSGVNNIFEEERER